MPLFVRSFSEGLIPEDKLEIYNYILSEWF